jgi:hypothetical protein
MWIYHMFRCIGPAHPNMSRHAIFRNGFRFNGQILDRICVAVIESLLGASQPQ